MRSGEEAGVVVAGTSVSTNTSLVAKTGVPGPGLMPLLTAGEGEPRPLVLTVPNSGGSNPTMNSNSSTNPSSGAGTQSGNLEQSEELVKPIFKEGEILLEVECGQNKAAMYLSKLCQGSKGPCILFQGSWFTPNEFQFVSGRETAKDWKRSIRHHGKSLKLLLAKGILNVHPTMCDCEGCRIGAVLTRKGEKRRIPNGERKRKSNGNTVPDNSSSSSRGGAFQAVDSTSAIKTPRVQEESLPDHKRVAIQKFMETYQSPLKESSVLNVKKDDGLQGPGPNKTPVDPRLVLTSPPTRVPTEQHLTDLNGNNTTTAVSSPSSVSSKDRLVSKEFAINSFHLDKQRHSSGHSNDSSSSSSSFSSSSNSNCSSDSSLTGECKSDVKVLSSSCTASTSFTPTDKIQPRLAQYPESSLSLKVDGPNVRSEPVTCVNANTKVSSGSPGYDERTAAFPIENNPTKEEVSDNYVKFVMAAASLASASVENKDANCNSEDKSKKPMYNDNTKTSSQCCSRPPESGILLTENNRPLLTSKENSPGSKPSTLPGDKPPTLPGDKPPNLPGDKPPNLPLPVQGKSSLITKSQTSKQPTSSHHTIKHTTSESLRSTQTCTSKPQTFKSKDIIPSKQHLAASSSAATDKERSKSQQNSDLLAPQPVEAGKRKTEDKSQEKERCKTSHTSTSASGGSSSKPSPVATTTSATVTSKATSQTDKADTPRSSEFAGNPSGRAEGVDRADVSAAHSDYMRMLAASQQSMGAPPAGCLPPLYPLRASDGPYTSTLLHPMQACAMFSSPGAFLPKDPALYPNMTGSVNPYAHAAVRSFPWMPSQLPSASPSVLDYSRAYPYMSWPTTFPVMTPEAVGAASMVGMKRPRDDVDPAMDPKRLRLEPAYFSTAGYPGMGAMTPMDYMAAYRGQIPVPMSCGIESNLYARSMEYLKKLYPDMSNNGSMIKVPESSYLASLPEYYRALYGCGCMHNRPEDIRTWSVEDVCNFLASLEGCGVYTELFREQRVDGRILVLLTTEHLMKNLGMKLGPAMLLSQRVAKLLQESARVSGCDTCKRLAAMVPAMHMTTY